ncbi:proto-oncogene tyrosine-protein kinase receptor Ret-like isoform X2 [Tachypleus tridentatus]|uniref:proto-oncogene tyrosine-protein kinase receptor Ret-like isoform X2 n=1 Tax=Tachypleus tridentatus TaxID=6853 RepID=UPI003FCF6DE7
MFVFFESQIQSTLRCGGACLLFPQRNINITLPIFYPSDVSFYQLIGIPADTFWSTSGGTVIYQITNVTLQEKDGSRHQRNDLFTINSSTGHLSLVKSLEPKTDFLGANFTIGLQAIEGNVSSTTSCLLNGNISDANDLCRPSFQFCFLSSYLEYDVPESLEPNVVFDHLRPQTVANICLSLKAKYVLIKGNTILSVDQRSGSLSLRHHLDADQNEAVHTFKIQCSVRNESFYLEGKVNVFDVNDNAPYKPQNLDSVINVDVNKIAKEGSYIDYQFNVFDKDSATVNNVEARIENDPLGFFNVVITEVYDRAVKEETFTVILVKTVKPLVLLEPDYNFSVIIEDNSVLKRKHHKVVYHVHVYNKTSTISTVYRVTVSRLATNFSRVLQPIPVKISEQWSFELTSEEGIFKVTPNTGIVYVANTERLQVIEGEMRLNLSWNDKRGKERNTVKLIVNVTDKDQSPQLEDCDFCAKYGVQNICLASCGIGTARAHCFWRENNYKIFPTTKYATCSSDIKTCPDGVCDELEKMYGHVCPQDCCENFEGSIIFPNNVSGKSHGIQIAVGTCTCSTINTCKCEDPMLIDSNNSYSLQYGDTKRRKNPKTLSKDAQDTNSDFSSTTACGEGCIALIFLALGGAFVECILFVLISRIKKYRKNKMTNEYVGNCMSLSVMTSEHINGRPSPVQDPQQSTSETSTGFGSKTLGDTRWEFPRDKLILEEKLGEGEFGKVVRAKAWGVNGHKGYTTVAVKMSKGNGSSSEQQDLYSEFNMLKEVSHPNVIKLLGACTEKDGPFYIIVEYAELGSLRSFLRKSRSLGFEFGDSSTVQVENPMYFPDSGDLCRGNDTRLTKRDLISFAWQITKGMAYLSDMKLIHRDLATRNILLAAGNVIKISDFGLSRDVYEGDSYLKKTKGRVPVKWVAIESLEDHVYTSKSDVWSFGVVLWEIVTLGASPYPGVEVERLYNLLKSGYRMEKPKSCSDRLYDIMKMCWRENPYDRPSFKDLVRKFDIMLQETAEYLDLSPIQNNDGPFRTGDENFLRRVISGADKSDEMSIYCNNMNQSDTTEELICPAPSQDSDCIQLISENRKESIPADILSDTTV